MWRLFVEQSELYLASISHFGKWITNQIHFGISNHLQYLHPSDVNSFSLSSSTHNRQFIIYWFVIVVQYLHYQPISISSTIFVLQLQYFHCYLHYSFLLHLFFNIVNLSYWLVDVIWTSFILQYDLEICLWVMWIWSHKVHWNIMYSSHSLIKEHSYPITTQVKLFVWWAGLTQLEYYEMDDDAIMSRYLTTNSRWKVRLESDS